MSYIYDVSRLRVKQLYLGHIRAPKTVKQLYLGHIRAPKTVKQLYLFHIRALKTVRQLFGAKPSPDTPFPIHKPKKLYRSVVFHSRDIQCRYQHITQPQWKII